jgi:hypothetical protein
MLSLGNNYAYLDPKFRYTNNNSVLHNLANIEVEQLLLVC